MMTVPMDSVRAPPSREQAQLLFKKNIELENGLRKSAQAKVPSDPSAWNQMRENYEKIILEDNEFSEKYEVEYLLWQLHYRRIEEFRQHLNAAASAESNAARGVKGQVRPDRIRKIRSVFKSFLTEATGFYHELILKIRAKYGLPLSYFSEGPETQIVSVKDGKRSAELKKGLTSCHRCLIYLGDLARYKGLYGEGDSVNRDYGTASSYYMQAVSLCPSSGNPHHQLAILASYSGDDLLALYRYFRSLAVESPFSTARDNLIIAFEKNRQRYSQLHVKASSGKALPTRPPRKARGEGKPMAKDTKAEDALVKEPELTIPEILKSFSTSFFRLNGILFTKTSLETFTDIFSVVTADLHVLLASGPGEELHFGQDAAENAFFVLRLVAILIFTVHNVKRESENQSYAEILQRTVLLQNAFIATFEIAGYILKRCTELRDFSSSFLLPAILVFIEWLACHPDIAGGGDAEEKQAGARAFFWNHCVLFMNKIILSELASLDGEEDEACFVNMSRYDEDQSDNRRALWEDFELRGFLPLVPAQSILDFSRKHEFMDDGNMMDSKSRAQRILAAGRALSGVVQIDQQRIYVDPNTKKFVLAMDPPVLKADVDSSTFPSALAVSAPVEQGSKGLGIMDIGGKQHCASDYGMMQLEPELYMNGEIEGEEIVFKPTVSEKYPNGSGLETINGPSNPMKVSSPGNWISSGPKLSAPLESLQFSTVPNDASHRNPIAPNISQPSFQYPDNFLHLDPFAPNVSQQPFQYTSPQTSTWFMKQEGFLSDSMYNMNIKESGYLNRLQDSLGNIQSTTYSTGFSAAPSPVTSAVFPSQVKVGEEVLPSSLDSIVPSRLMLDSLAVKSAAPLPVARKNPVGRPIRHLGPPPGFSSVVAKQQDETNHNSVMKVQRSEVDGSGSAIAKGAGVENFYNQPLHMLSPVVSNSFTPFAGASGFPFPGKQYSNVQTPVANERNWPDFQLFEQLKPYAEKQVQSTNSQQSLLPEQHEAQSLWSNRYFV